MSASGWVITSVRWVGAGAVCAREGATNVMAP